MQSIETYRNICYRWCAAFLPLFVNVYLPFGSPQAPVSKFYRRICSHYAFYLRDGMSVLEFGAAEKSYLPDDLKFSRHVGVGLSTEQMGENPAITERLEADLNKVVEERGVDSDELRELGTNTFDVVLMANTIDFLENPREVLR